jgi:hypothetical protein
MVLVSTCSPALALTAALAALVLGACGAESTAQRLGDGNADVIDAPAGADLVALGEECSDDRGCASGFCADGVCCGTRCPGPCQRCDQAASRGTCTLVPGGSACGGNLCLGGSFVPQATCDDQGMCRTQAPISCAPARCLDNRCVTVCSRDDECEAPFVCRLGACTKPGGGVACAGNDECQSGICAQGVCCNRACNLPCESCALPAFRGVCQPVPVAERPDAGCAADAGVDASSD